jgi:hypothetical protein
MTVLQIGKLLRVLSLELAPNVIRRLEYSFHVFLGGSLAVDEFGFSPVEFVLEALDTFFKAGILPRKESLVLVENIGLPTEGLTPFLEVLLEVIRS